MKQARLVFAVSDAAVADILEQVEWYAGQSGIALAERWEEAVTSALLRMVKNPAAGAPCRFRPAELRNVRRVTIRVSPCTCCFTEFGERKSWSFALSMERAIWRSSVT